MFLAVWENKTGAQGAASCGGWNSWLNCRCVLPQVLENKRYAGNEGWTVSECAAKVGGVGRGGGDGHWGASLRLSILVLVGFSAHPKGALGQCPALTLSSTRSRA